MKTRPIKDTLYAYWSDDNKLDYICAPATRLDKVTGGWEFITDAYYMGPPKRSPDGHWDHPERNIYFTKSDEDVAFLLGREPGENPYQYHPQVTKRAIGALVALGYMVVVRKEITTTIRHRLTMDKTFDPDHRESERVVGHETTTEQWDGCQLRKQ